MSQDRPFISKGDDRTYIKNPNKELAMSGNEGAREAQQRIEKARRQRERTLDLSDLKLTKLPEAIALAPSRPNPPTNPNFPWLPGSAW